MSRFSKDTVNVLQRAGWTEARNIDPISYIQCLEQRGFTVFPSVVAFLREFGGLYIAYPATPSFYAGGVKIAFPESVACSMRVKAHFDVCRTSRSCEIADLLKGILGSAVCWIGEDKNGLMDLWMDENGNVYASDEGDWQALLGNNAEEGIEAIIQDTMKHEILCENGAQ